MGLIGRPHLVKVVSLGWLLFATNEFRRFKERTGGGVFIDTGVHFVYILRYLFGDVQSVGAIQTNSVRHEMEGEDTAIVSLYSEEDRFPGEFRGWTTIAAPNAYADAFNLEVEHFIDCLIHRTSPKVPATEARKTLEVIDAAYRSAETGQLISLNG